MSLISHTGEKEVIAPVDAKADFAQFTSLSKFTSLASLDTTSINQSISQSVSLSSSSTSQPQTSESLITSSTSQSTDQSTDQSTKPRSTNADLLDSLFELESIDKIVEESSLAAWGLTELEDAIATMEREKQRENEAEISANMAAVATTQSLAALPHQRGYSQQIHSALLEQYSKLKKLNGQTPKQAFQSRKAKRQQSRQAKKAEATFDKLSNRLSNQRNKAKARSKAKY